MGVDINKKDCVLTQLPYKSFKEKKTSKNGLNQHNEIL